MRHNIRDLIADLPGPWMPRDVVSVNDAIVRVARIVVPTGARHRPVSTAPAHAVLLERPETKQYGSEEGTHSA